MNPFLQRYQTHSNAALLKILSKPGDYQPPALEAARQVLDSRNLSEAELAAAHTELETDNAGAAAKTVKEQELKNKAQAIGNSVLNEINPFHVNSPTVKRIIVITTLVFTWFALHAVYVMYSNWRVFMFGFDESVIIALIALYLIPLLQIAGTVLFALRKKSGWIILAAYSVLTAFAVIPAIVANVTYLFNPPEPTMLDNIFERPPGLAENVTSLVVFPGLLAVMNRADVREVYRVNRKTFVIILVITGAFVLGVFRALMQ